MSQLWLARELKMTLGELQEKMTPAELHLWIAYINLTNQKEEEARKKAQQRRR